MNFPFKSIIPTSVINRFWHLPKGILAATLAGFPAKKLTVIAVAGTKGKTSTAYYISHFLDHAGIKNALFTTAAQKIAGKEELNPLKLTTPTPFYLQSFLNQALRKGCTHLVLEVSSHALLQQRVWGIPFHIVVFTNLSPDHREIHASDAEYHDIHYRLLTPETRHVVINGDDSHLAAIERRTSCAKTVFKKTDPLSRELAEIGIPLPGSFNLENVVAAYHAIRALGISHDKLIGSISSLKSAPGRMERLVLGQSFSIIVDYAHSPVSLETFFTALPASGKRIVVFGACGERDPSARPEMGRILDSYADIIVVTNDDPYSESPDTIAEGLMSGIANKKMRETLFLIHDRRAAIRQALSLGSANDTVCILGKGAEQWQVIGNKKIPWDDRTVVREELWHVLGG